jgi:hypothetical protein
MNAVALLQEARKVALDYIRDYLLKAPDHAFIVPQEKDEEEDTGSSVVGTEPYIGRHGFTIWYEIRKVYLEESEKEPGKFLIYILGEDYESGDEYHFEGYEVGTPMLCTIAQEMYKP